MPYVMLAIAIVLIVLGVVVMNRGGGISHD